MLNTTARELAITATAKIKPETAPIMNHSARLGPPDVSSDNLTN